MIPTDNFSSAAAPAAATNATTTTDGATGRGTPAWPLGEQQYPR